MKNLAEVQSNLAKLRISQAFDDTSGLFKQYEQYRKLHEINKKNRYFPTKIFHHTNTPENDSTDEEEEESE
ncbi:MAG: hypothetical protein I4N51_19130 [Acinetobacter sp.]|nr:hypothetical protein [Acinetobacter sp.]